MVPPKRNADSLRTHDFRFSFTPLNGVLFTFPSRYWFAIGHRRVFSLGGWSPRIQTEFHVFRPTRDACGLLLVFADGAVTLCGAAFQRLELTSSMPCAGPATPMGKPIGLGCSAFARRYLRNLG